MNITLLINKAFNVFKTFLKAMILLWIILFIVIFYKSSEDTKPKTCDTMAQQAQEAMKQRQQGVSLTDALNGASDKDQSKIIAFVYDTPIYKDKTQKAHAIETMYNSALAECVKAK